jgi:hypothetical protein
MILMMMFTHQMRNAYTRWFASVESSAWHSQSIEMFISLCQARATAREVANIEVAKAP